MWQAEATILQTDCDWTQLLFWLQSRTMSFLNAGLPSSLPSFDPATRSQLLTVLQGWAHQPSLQHLDAEDADAANADQDAPQADATQAAPGHAAGADVDGDGRDASPSSAASA